MNEADLVEKLRERFVSEVVGERKPRTVEEALQEALDNTTPEFPGVPNPPKYDDEEFNGDDWI